MPREGVTLGQVEEAIEALTAAHQPTSIRRVRAELGEGSLTTIANHIRELTRQRQVAHGPFGSDRANQPALPDPVVKQLFAGAASTWEQLLDAAEGFIAEAAQAADEKVAAADLAAQQAIALRDDVDAHNTVLSEALAQSQAEFRALSQAHDTLTSDHQARLIELAAAHTKIEGLHELVAELKHNNAQLTTAMKNADQRTARAQDQLTAAEQAHQDTVAACRAEMAKDRQAVEGERDRETQRADTLQQQVVTLDKEVAALSAQHTAECEAHQRTRSERQRVMDELDERTRERDEVATHRAQLEERLTASAAALTHAQDRATELIAEKDRRLAEQAASLRDVTAALKRAQTVPRKPE